MLYLYYFFRSVFLRGFVNTLRLLRAERTYDKKFGIKTATIKKSDSDEFYHYQGAGYLALLTILREMVKDTSEYEFIDIGCGKGRAVFAAEFCGYNHITGIELDHELIKEAVSNLSTYTCKRRESDIRFITVNALDYDYKNKPAVYFFFNPFNENVMRKVLEKIVSSSDCNTWFIYMNPQYKKPFAQKKIRFVKEFKVGRYVEAAIYRRN